MAKDKKDLKILLLQIRGDEVVAHDEYKAFRDYGGFVDGQIDIHNVFETPNFSTDIINGYDALFVGGASEASVLEPDKYTFVKDSCILLNYCIERKLPVFASCFGFQLAVIALGGSITKDLENFEMGTCSILLTDKSRDDLLFKDTPSGFKAVSVHQEKAIELPESCELLAYTDDCCHSFKIKDAPFWAFQFHPEVNKEVLINRLGFYRDKYTDGDDHYNDIISDISETPESNILVAKFIERVVLPLQK
jgi:GMP synthase (glutamine-hydrolysing)